MPIYAYDGISPELPQDDDFWVAPDANLIGKVRLGAGANIWFGATLRGDNEWIEVGRGSNIQEGAIGHTDPGYPLTIGMGVTVGHGAIVHGCTIEDEVLIGMGATVLNGAVIGAGSVVGAGALVTEGKVFEPGSLIVGAPGRAKGQVSEALQKKSRSAAVRYVERARAFKASLKVVG